MGPMNQMKKMFEPTRLVASIVFLVGRRRATSIGHAALLLCE